METSLCSLMVVCSTGAASELVASAKRLAATEQMEYFPGSYRFCFRFCVFVCGLRIVGKKNAGYFLILWTGKHMNVDPPIHVHGKARDNQ